jgi:hypothetical protein
MLTKFFSLLFLGKGEKFEDKKKFGRVAWSRDGNFHL